MLISELKSRESLLPVIEGKKLFLVNCHGCGETGFPFKEAEAFQNELHAAGCVTGTITTYFVCNTEIITYQLGYQKEKIEQADAILVFSCGVGVQTVATLYPDKAVYAACNTIRLPGTQGVTPSKADCIGCGECYLNLTGGICPITACSKGLLNGPCGGTKDGMCEVNPEMKCGWERIYKRLEEQGKTDIFNCKVQLRDYSTFEVTKDHKETDK